VRNCNKTKETSFSKKKQVGMEAWFRAWYDYTPS
jgi:hypothetical protein